MGCDDGLLEIAERASVRNKGIAAEGKKPCVGTVWVPEIFGKMGMADRSAYLEGLKRLGVDVLMDDEGWKAKKKEDGTWGLRSYKIVLGIDMADKTN